MGIYTEQIKSRIDNDKSGFDESFFRLASVVTGDTRDADSFLSDREKAQNAIQEILKFFKVLPAPMSDDIETVDGQLEYLLRPSGIMRRRVELSGNWYKDGAGVLLGETNNGSVIALLPGKISGYTYFDHSAGRNVKVTKKNADSIRTDAFCFYKPLPQRKLGIRDLLRYMASALAVSDLVMVGLSMLSVTLLGMLIPYANRLLFTRVALSGQTLQLVSVAVLLLGATVSTALINITRQTLLAGISSKIDISVQSASMARILTLPAVFFKEYSAGALAQRLKLLHMMSGQLTSVVIKTTLSTLFSLVYIVQIGVFAPALAIPALVCILAGLAFAIISALAAAKASHAEMEEKTKLSGLVYALFSGIQKIRLAGCEQRAFTKWAVAYEKTAKKKYTPPLLVRISPVIQTAILAAGSVFLFFKAGTGGVSAADYMAFASGYGVASAAVVALAAAAIQIQVIKPMFEMVRPILETEPETAGGKKVITGLSGSVEINNMSFRYRDDMPNVLNDISIKIRPGQYVAIVGASGCGKSTLLRLLLGFEKPSSGAIYYDGRDINSIDLKSLRRNIGSVIQNGKLMSGDIFSNITVSAPLLSLSAAWEAAELASVADDIRAMPMGMHTIVSEGGGGLSGGQKQRLMIARAIASKPKILILDEATSALDNLTQKRVSESLNKMKCTRIVIAHRLSTIKQCNRIIFLEKGKIVEDGTYDELIALKGKFAELVGRQMLDQEGYIL